MQTGSWDNARLSSLRRPHHCPSEANAYSFLFLWLADSAGVEEAFSMENQLRKKQTSWWWSSSSSSSLSGQCEGSEMKGAYYNTPEFVRMVKLKQVKYAVGFKYAEKIKQCILHFSQKTWQWKTTWNTLLYGTRLNKLNAKIYFRGRN
jgi:hypothetical protein